MKPALRALALFAPLLLAFAVPARAADPEPRAIDVFVNLVLGACMAEKAGTSLVPDAIDPAATGVPVAATNEDPRLGPGALRVPSTDGVVYHDRDAESCLVHADGIDAQAALERVRDLLKGAGVPVMAFTDAVVEDAAGVSRRTAVYGVMVSPTAPALPLVTLSYPVEQAAIMTGGVKAGRAE